MPSSCEERVPEGAEARAERLAAMVAHELKNPLAAALSNVGAVLEMTSAEDPRRQFLEHSEHDLLRVRDLLRACLDLGRCARITPVTQRLDELVAGVGRRRRAELDAIGITLSFGDDAPVIWARVDGLLVERVLDNLLDNAVHAIAPPGAPRRRGSHIVMAAARSHHGVELSVEDDGPGVPAALRQRLFTPFVTGGGGSGLGLFFVRQVAEAHGGRVLVETAATGGARFVVRFS
jgi:two-component system nitrogen regulation sensor histidine kinase GlnL